MPKPVSAALSLPRRKTSRDAERRLLRVTTQARVRFYPRTYAFLESPLASFPAASDPQALALVRHDDVWSQLVAGQDAAEELFGLFRCHFPSGMDDSANA